MKVCEEYWDIVSFPDIISIVNEHVGFFKNVCCEEFKIIIHVPILLIYKREPCTNTQLCQRLYYNKSTRLSFMFITVLCNHSIIYWGSCNLMDLKLLSLAYYINLLVTTVIYKDVHVHVYPKISIDKIDNYILCFVNIMFTTL